MAEGNGSSGWPNGTPPTPFGSGSPEFTGRMIAVVEGESMSESLRRIRDVAGIRTSEVHVADEGAPIADFSTGNHAFPLIGAVVLEADPDQMNAINAASETTATIVAAERERYVYALAAEVQPHVGWGVDELPHLLDESPQTLGVVEDTTHATALRVAADPTPTPPLSLDYLKGIRDSVDFLINHVRQAERGEFFERGAEQPLVEAWNESQATWGLQATRVVESRFTGKGIKIAVLDTGFGPHQDFGDRPVIGASFIAGQTYADGHGHGTLCAGTACGPRAPRSLPRYGVAHGASLLVAKVLNNAGLGTDGGVLAGINWAIANGAKILSMSLGAPTQLGEAPSLVYELVARRALLRGTLIFTAAGNESRRPGYLAPAGRPASSPSIVAVASVDPSLGVSHFSSAGRNPTGGEVNIAAPGRDVHSSIPFPPYYRKISGTSMAAPHAAGIAALWAEATRLTGLPLWMAISRNARRLSLPARDVGVGLVQAPR